MNRLFNKLKLRIKKKSDNNENYLSDKEFVDDYIYKFYIKTIYSKTIDNIENDIVYEMYKEDKLNSSRLLYIIENCIPLLNISTSLIIKLMEDNSKELLEVIFKNYFKFFDNFFVIDCLNYYKNKTPLSDSELYTKINDDKYKLTLTYWKENIHYLFKACKIGNKAAVIFLLDHVVYPIVWINKINKDGRTPLFIACQEGHIAIVKYLVDHGANLNREDYDGWTPLYFACKKEYIIIVKYLVDHGANINKENSKDGNPLSIACQVGNMTIVKYLVEHGANINRETNDGKTPLYFAFQRGQKDIIEYLVNRGAHINKKFILDQNWFFNAC